VSSPPPCIAWNGIPLLTPLTGVGRYTAELLRAMVVRQPMLGVEAEAVMPFAVFLARHWQVVGPSFVADPDSVVHGEAGPAAALAQSGLWRRFLRRLPGTRTVARQLQRRYFSQGCPGHRAVLYHEPNFIAFPFRGPTVVTVHDLSFLRHPETHPVDRVRFMSRNIQGSLDRAQAVVVVSEFVRQELQQCFGSAVAQKTYVVPNGVSDAFFEHTPAQTAQVCARYGLSHKAPGQGFVLSVGALEPRKNLATLIRAYVQLPQSIKARYPLVLVGPKAWQTGPLEALLQAHRHEPIRWLGYVRQQDLPALYAAASVFVYPSIYEGFGLPVLEAMASGTPVLVSQAGALCELVGDAGCVASSHDPSAFAQALAALLEDTPAAQAQARAALARAAERSWYAAADRLWEVYRPWQPA